MGVSSVAVGFRHIDDDALRPVVGGVGFVGDGGEGAEGAEEQLGGVGHDGGAAGSDFVTGL